MEEDFLKIVEKTFWKNYNIYNLDWWKCALNNDWNMAFAISNWRYPEDKELFSINKICTEKIIVLSWKWTLTLNDEIVVLKQWSEVDIEPWNKYSIEWNELLSRVEI